MKKGIALCVSVLALAACGGPLEDEQTLGTQEQTLDVVAEGGSGHSLRVVKTPFDATRSSPAPRAEERFYAPGAR